MKDFKNIILLSDMDGTLLDSNCKVSVENRRAIKSLIAQGGMFGIATGRSQINCVNFLDDVEINAPCILYNGCGLYDFDRKEFLVLHELPKKKLKVFLEHCLTEYPDVSILVYCTQMCYCVSSQPKADKDFIINHMPCEFSGLEDILELQWIKVLLRGKPDELKTINGLMKDMGLEKEIRGVYSSAIYLELLPNGITKGSAISGLREHMGESYKIYAVGDYDNDAEMLREADVSIATQNAVPSIKEIADLTTVSNDESAIADIIYHIIGIKK